MYYKNQSYAPARWWNERGYTIYRGQRSYTRNEWGVPMFARDQVYKSHASIVGRQKIVEHYPHKTIIRYI